MTTNITEAEIAGLDAARSIWARPCPSWCPSAGHHVWQVLPNGKANRFHTAEVLVGALIDDEPAPVRVAAHVWETESDPAMERAVQIATAEDATAELTSRAEVDALVSALLHASHKVFPEQHTREAMSEEIKPWVDAEREVEAASAEVAQRAEHPEDVNRLVAAARRLHDARRVLAGLQPK